MPKLDQFIRIEIRGQLNKRSKKDIVSFKKETEKYRKIETEWLEPMVQGWNVVQWEAPKLAKINPTEIPKFWEERETKREMWNKKIEI